MLTPKSRGQHDKWDFNWNVNAPNREGVNMVLQVYGISIVTCLGEKFELMAAKNL